MKLKLSLMSGSERDDIVVTVDATATVGQMAERLRVSHPRSRSLEAGETLTVRVHPGTAAEHVLSPTATMGEVSLRSGDEITLTHAAALGTPAVAMATLRVLEGPDAGRSFQLPSGTTFVGRERSCEVRLTDSLVSKRHAKLIVTDMIEVVDDNSANGVFVNGERAQRAVVTAADTVQIGDTAMSVTLHRSGAGSAATGHAIEFNRSPRLDPTYPGIELVAPEPPARPQPPRFPLIALVAPVMMAGMMYAITKNATSILFVALSPLMLVGGWAENRVATKRAVTAGIAAFRSGLTDLAVQLQYAGEAERTARRREHPSVDDLVTSVARLDALTWTRRPQHERFLELRLGLGVLPSRNSVELPRVNNTFPELWAELQSVAGQYVTIDRVPVVASLRECGGLGIAGPAAIAHPLAAAAVVQLVALHSPAEVVVAAIMDSTSQPRWEWLKWLPHAGSDHSPLGCEHLATSTAAATALIAALEAEVDSRPPADRDARTLASPAIVLIVEDDAVHERARLVTLAERGPAHGVFVVWAAAALSRVPAACRTYLEVDPNTGEGRVGLVDDGVAVAHLELEPLTVDAAAATARRLAPVIDAGALLDDDSDLPRSVSFVTLGGTELAEQPAEIVERWAGTNSLPPVPGAPRLRADNTLRALVGQAALDRFYLDLRVDGPHALVGGTTGSGKSEFLQSWILGMAAAHSPARVSFLFVDYKGGAAFADCVKLPHCVGLVTDLSPHLVRRALRSLVAELRRREHILNRKKAKDLLELERRRDPEAPPSLVIVVDEFAALINEVPEFVDGVVDVAQRGRSLGLHLILATQRPAGVIKGNLRANTNLRVALRMADDVDSEDVIGTAQAAAFDPSLPGRGVAKTGPGRLLPFQAAYAGGHTSSTPPPPVIEVHELPFGVGAPWDVSQDPPDYRNDAPAGPNDIQRVVANIEEAARSIGIAEPRRPWLPELASVYRLQDLPTDRTDRALVFGVLDAPDEQDQPVVAFRPDVDGNMAAFGTGGSGKSALLRTIAVAAGFAPARGGPCTVYAFDFGSRGLQMLESLPHVAAVVNADDNERVVRVVRELRATIDDRAARFAEVNASTIDEYRERSGNRDETRILLLVDNFGAFRSAYELGPQSRWFDTFQAIAADGRGVGVHLVLTADRPAAVPASLGSAIPRRLVLRLANEMDYSMLNVPADVLDASSPPGRGVVDDSEVQIAVLGGTANVARQAAEIDKLAAAMERAGVARVARVARLADRIAAADLPATVGGLPTLGVWDETLQPIGFEPSGMFLVSGPPQSGRTTTVAAMVDSLRRSGRPYVWALFAPRRSPLVGGTWDHVATDADAMNDLAQSLAGSLNAEEPATRDLVVVVEGIGDLLNGPADGALQDLFKACRAADRLVIVDGETSSVGSSWPLLQAVKAGRYGIAMQPEQMDGDNLYKTAFPRTSRAEYPPGRGLYVRGGRVARVQVGLP